MTYLGTFGTVVVRWALGASFDQTEQKRAEKGRKSDDFVTFLLF